jgi:hypothetical protein
MNERKKSWITSKIRTSWISLAAGLVLFAAGIALNGQTLPFDPRIISAGGILLAGIGAALWVRYGALMRDPVAAQRANVEERDERSRSIRAQAGNRAFWVAIVLVYAGLMWVSFASNGQVPALSADGLWFFLAGCVVVPLGVYVTGILLGEKNG